MSGPGLRHIDSHSAIHEAAHIAVEHWETRILRHAQAEEEGLYKEMVEEKPELKDDIIGLIRDHDILRFTVKEIKEMFGLKSFYAQYTLNLPIIPKKSKLSLFSILSKY